MGVSLSYECCAFIQAALSGAAGALVYSFRKNFLRRHTGRAANAVTAAVFFAGFFAVWFFMTYRYTRAFFRAYEFLALGLGFATTALAAGKVCGKVFDKIIYFFEIILKYLLTPARFLYTILLRRKQGKIQRRKH